MRWTLMLRGLGAAALLAVAAVHLYEYYVDHYSAIPTIGVLFLLNGASATVLGLALLVPVERLAPRRAGSVALQTIAAAGIGLAGTSLAALFVSESTPLFGFMEIGYRLVVVLAIVAETTSILVLGALLLALRLRRRALPRHDRAAGLVAASSGRLAGSATFRGRGVGPSRDVPKPGARARRHR